MPSKEVNKDLQIERNKCSFNNEEFTLWWIGGETKLKEKHFREKFFLSEPEFFDKTPLHFASHKEIYEESIRKSTLIFRKVKKLQEQGKDGVDNYMALLGGLLGSGIIREGNPLAVHFVMFLPAIMGHGTPEQQAEWIGRAWNCNIIGTYAQTELGHGTFIRGLETTATYDEKTKEVVINSPTLSSYKWWPGGLGHTANYCIVIAQLYSKGHCHGIHPFIVQLRDEETHMPLPGITIGEIGNKLGMNGVNNGFLGFKNVRIPRTNMLMKNAQLHEDGTFVKPPSSVLTYGTMMFVRVVIVRDMANYLSKAVTIATRYSCVRRQSVINPDQPEVQIIDHVTQQYKLFPAIAKSIIFKLTSDNLWEMYNQVTSELDKGDLERLPELHAIACCLKAVCTADAAQAVETCRLACGGHGYMTCANLFGTYGMVTAACTYEGENTVLLLQTARYLLKVWTQAQKGQELVPTVDYLKSFISSRNRRQTWNDSVPGIIKSLQTIAAGKLRLASEHIEQRKQAGYSQEEAVNLTSLELTHTVDAHCRAFLVQSGYDMIEKACATATPELTRVLRDIYELYAYDEAIKAVGDLLRFTTISESDITRLQQKLEDSLAAIRPNAIGIVDSFDIPDVVLGSALGAYDGNVYERLFEEAKKSPLNQEPVNKSFHMYLKPFMKSSL
ncbi:probable peroxisomal acyl-coenzyme A oxidase 1 [Wyeomyia smithii]|uniref:probable peroxisomal acyl-coenzyme A oxidase 1 n=1 Tax=Wyeomyia smithii TaxID=174621 RepID=UPI0024682271|nr:probable peroxisomal acyl-coenzyme A oxidase 1 [Wyeomyia smithii]XP_055529884.1 probable peroxisomal acyl-coenzyme A oxidase 1 [Wyeomyia smithii]